MHMGAVDEEGYLQQRWIVFAVHYYLLVGILLFDFFQCGIFPANWSYSDFASSLLCFHSAMLSLCYAFTLQCFHSATLSLCYYLLVIIYYAASIYAMPTLHRLFLIRTDSFQYPGNLNTKSPSLAARIYFHWDLAVVGEVLCLQTIRSPRTSNRVVRED